MEWMKSLMPLLQAGLKAYLGGGMIRTSAEQAKEIAVRSSVVAFGSLSFLVFLAAAIIMVFVDLGHQFETGRDLYFSGMMLAALYLAGFGAALLGICVGISKILSKREIERLEAAKARENAYAPLISLAEEALRQWIAYQEQKRQSAASGSAVTAASSAGAGSAPIASSAPIANSAPVTASPASPVTPIKKSESS